MDKCPNKVYISGQIDKVFECKIMKMKDLNINRPVTRLDRHVHLFDAGVSLTLNMFRITTENKRGKIILSVEGRLVGAAVQTLEQCWRELSNATPKPKFHVNLCGASFIDNAGKVLAQRDAPARCSPRRRGLPQSSHRSRDRRQQRPRFRE